MAQSFRSLQFSLIHIADKNLDLSGNNVIERLVGNDITTALAEQLTVWTNDTTHKCLLRCWFKIPFPAHQLACLHFSRLKNEKAPFPDKLSPNSLLDSQVKASCATEAKREPCFLSEKRRLCTELKVIRTSDEASNFIRRPQPECSLKWEDCYKFKIYLGDRSLGIRK